MNILCLCLFVVKDKATKNMILGKSLAVKKDDMNIMFLEARNGLSCDSRRIFSKNYKLSNMFLLCQAPKIVKRSSTL